ncbi:beta-galactosidase [Capsulimonas corticalis]|uniref:beta-galactosidase n=1 Tax=Capsulimonas corticalis TaxID=2219043 RepID=A0A402D1N6_9BACT|nr:glycoside hydrolase family 2 TIM barrel-domain containing protein [Capsulimonas corticalis]BDI28702.1 beta-galactosidase [Capsulimonas corticalis]
MMFHRSHLFAAGAAFAALIACAPRAYAQDTQTQYLTGHDKDDAVPWDFFCTAGAKGNRWTTVPVPSQWEFHGFGKLSYGVDMGPGPIVPVEGRYRRRFRTPENWTGQRTFLVFEGSMTDTQVTVNGVSAGPAHQGGYYQFRYEITKLLKPGEENLLEVTVDDESSDASINSAERRGDYWNYGGIYRPVYLESVPTEFIKRVAIDARADGALAVDVFGDAVASADHVQAQVLDLKGRPVGRAFSLPISSAQQTVKLRSQLDAPKLWTAETPNLYQLEVRLMRGQTIVHRVKRRFGFRTIELRAGDGIYVNGKRVLLKGSDRHSFWPESGRCTSDKISRLDIGLMKDMNMNAVRMSHYPPDQHFLDDCDELGLYVLDELGGWQHKYDTGIGKKLVEEMVTRDVNHPSIVFWDNANEGGWNTALDTEFALWDPQGRTVIHPGGTIASINDDHYPNYERIQKVAAGDRVFLPTEFLHGLYDGGAGAGLADYWDVIRQSKVGGGGIIWAFLDETVKRVDLDGRMDTRGNLAPDGILGPYRQKEGSYNTVKEIWSPIVIREKQIPADFDGVLTLENRYDFLDARQCRYAWSLRKFQSPASSQSGDSVVSQGTAHLDRSIAPGTSGTLKLDLPQNWRQAEALSLRVDDPQGRELWTWVWPLPHADDFRAITGAPGAAHVQSSETPDQITVRSGDLTVNISKQNGQLISADRHGKKFSLLNGPRLAVGDAALASIEGHSDGSDFVVTASYTGDMKSVQWRVKPNGWVQMDYDYMASGPHDYFGVSFDYPEANVQSMTWLGNGPYRAWKNRMAGGVLGVWSAQYNDTITGDSGFQYPEFKGYYAGVRWAKLQTTEGPITMELGQDDLFLQMLTPRVPANNKAVHAQAPFPAAGISFLNAIPAMGNKFSRAEDTGPMGQKAIGDGERHGSVNFYFGDPPR